MGQQFDLFADDGRLSKSGLQDLDDAAEAQGRLASPGGLSRGSMRVRQGLSGLEVDSDIFVPFWARIEAVGQGLSVVLAEAIDDKETTLAVKAKDGETLPVLLAPFPALLDGEEITVLSIAANEADDSRQDWTVNRRTVGVANIFHLYDMPAIPHPADAPILLPGTVPLAFWEQKFDEQGIPVDHAEGRFGTVDPDVQAPAYEATGRLLSPGDIVQCWLSEDRSFFWCAGGAWHPVWVRVTGSQESYTLKQSANVDEGGTNDGYWGYLVPSQTDPVQIGVLASEIDTDGFGVMTLENGDDMPPIFPFQAEVGAEIVTVTGLAGAVTDRTKYLVLRAQNGTLLPNDPLVFPVIGEPNPDNPGNFPPASGTPVFLWRPRCSFVEQELIAVGVFDDVTGGLTDDDYATPLIEVSGRELPISSTVLAWPSMTADGLVYLCGRAPGLTLIPFHALTWKDSDRIEGVKCIECDQQSGLLMYNLDYQQVGLGIQAASATQAGIVHGDVTVYQVLGSGTKSFDLIGVGGLTLGWNENGFFQLNTDGTVLNPANMTANNVAAQTAQATGTLTAAKLQGNLNAGVG